MRRASPPWARLSITSTRRRSKHRTHRIKGAAHAALLVLSWQRWYHRIMTSEHLIDTTMGDWKLKLRPPVGKPDRVIFLVHGWTGDENSMWVFAPRMPKDALLIAPRAPFTSRNAEFGGYSWVPQRGNDFSPLEAFQQAVDEFGGLIAALSKEYDSVRFQSLFFCWVQPRRSFLFCFRIDLSSQSSCPGSAGRFPARWWRRVVGKIG